MKMKRQAMRVTIKELKDLIFDLEKQNRELEEYLGIKIEQDSFLISIINKKPECSDTWELEK